MGSQEAVASLMDLRSGIEGGSFIRSPSGQVHPSRRIEGLILISDRVRDLYQQYVTMFLLDDGQSSLTDKQLLLRLPSLPTPA